ncbi:MAG: hypothetical protein JNK72_25595 [Myxococcales bacterium]|nr:hypothetical protein [Myxococcales bacterium]
MICLRRGLCGALLVALLGCQRFDVRVVPLGPLRGLRHAAMGVRVLRPPVTAMHYEELALLEVTGYVEDADDEAIEALREAAGGLGAEAVLVARIDRTRGFLRVTASALRSISARPAQRSGPKRGL